MDPIRPDRGRLIYAVVLLASTTPALVPTVDLVPEIWPVVKQLDPTRFVDPTYAEHLFHGKPKSRRGDSVGIRARAIVRPILEGRKPRWTYVDLETQRPVTEEKAMRNWVRGHSRVGAAIGFALAQDGYALGFPFLIGWSLGLVILFLLPPRTPWRTLWRRPGWWAALAPVVTFGFLVLLELHERYPIPSILVPASVAFAWSGLALMRRWQAEPSWIDRAGRVLGVLWLATIPVYLIGQVFVLWR
jgi:hypothetical protein